MSSFTAPVTTPRDPQATTGQIAVPTDSPSPTLSVVYLVSGVYLRSMLDFMMALQACFNGELSTFTRPKEKTGIATSGSAYVYEAASSGIKRWTDDKKWSPSRGVHNSFLYREHAKPGEETMSSTDGHGPQEPQDKILTGNFTNTSKFKKNGLVKRTMTFRLEGKEYHVLNYYSLNLEDENGRPLQRPIDMPHLYRPLHQGFASSYDATCKVAFMDEINQSYTVKPEGYTIYERHGWLDCFKNPPSPQHRGQNHSSSQHQAPTAQHQAPTGVPMSAGQFASHPNLHAMHPATASGQPSMTFTGPNAYGPPPGNHFAVTQPFQAQPQQEPLWYYEQIPATLSDPNNSNPGALGPPYRPPSNTSGESIGSFAPFDLNLTNNPGTADIPHTPTDNSGGNNGSSQVPIHPNLFNNPGALGTSRRRARVFIDGTERFTAPLAPPPHTSTHGIGESQTKPTSSQSADNGGQTYIDPVLLQRSGGTEHIDNDPDEAGYNPFGDVQNY